MTTVGHFHLSGSFSVSACVYAGTSAASHIT